MIVASSTTVLLIVAVAIVPVIAVVPIVAVAVVIVTSSVTVVTVKASTLSFTFLAVGGLGGNEIGYHILQTLNIVVTWSK